jgi:hypothetical protein
VGVVVMTILLDSVAAGVRRLGAALAHADSGGMDHSDGVSALLAEMGYALDEAIRLGADRPIAPGVVEWILTAPDQAETVARVAIWITDAALDIDDHEYSRDGAPVDPGSMVARAALLLSLECSVLAHRPEVDG